MWDETREVGRDALRRALHNVKNFNLYLESNENQLRVLRGGLYGLICVFKISLWLQEKELEGDFVDAGSPVSRLL